MELWFLTNLEIFHRERDVFDQLTKEASWLTAFKWSVEDSALCIYANIVVNEHDYPVKLVYPAHFPDVVPSVFPQDKDARWSLHQYPDSGALCLEWGPDNWVSTTTGADLVKSAFKLLSIENPLARSNSAERLHAPSRHQLELGQELRQKLCRCLFTRELQEHVNKPEISSALLRFSFEWEGGSYVVFLHEVSDGANVWLDPRIPTTIKGRQKDKDWFSGALTKLANLKTSLPDCNDIKELFAIGVDSEWLNALLEKSRETQTCFGLALLNAAGNLRFYFINKEGKVFNHSSVVEETELKRSPDFIVNLANKKVGIVGLGSIGARVALSLLRTGVKQFYLLDHDILMPDNIQRHVLDWKSVVEHKVKAVECLMKEIDNGVNIETNSISLTGQESSNIINVCLRKLASCDLIIDATSSPRVFNLLSSVSYQEHKKMVWAAVFAGGKAGLVGRSNPSVDPDAKIIRSCFNEFCIAHPLPDTSAKEVQVEYGFEDEAGNVMIASDIDVSVIAAIMSHLVIDTILDLGEYEYPLYLIGLHKWWVFKSPLEVIPIDCGKQVQVLESSANKWDESDKKFLSELLENDKNDKNNSTK